MRMTLVVNENSAVLQIDAESNFEKEMLKHVEDLPQIRTSINTTQEWGITTKGYMKVYFSTQE